MFFMVHCVHDVVTSEAVAAQLMLCYCGLFYW